MTEPLPETDPLCGGLFGSAQTEAHICSILAAELGIPSMDDVRWKYVVYSEDTDRKAGSWDQLRALSEVPARAVMARRQFGCGWGLSVVWAWSETPPPPPPPLAPTPAPWRWYADGGRYGSDARHAYGAGFAGVVWGPKGPGHGAIATCGTYNNATKQDAANAKFIGRIHDLVRLLKLALAHRDTSSGEDPRWVKDAVDLLKDVGLPYPSHGTMEAIDPIG